MIRLAQAGVGDHCLRALDAEVLHHQAPGLHAGLDPGRALAQVAEPLPPATFLCCRLGSRVRSLSRALDSGFARVHRVLANGFASLPRVLGSSFASLCRNLANLLDTLLNTGLHQLAGTFQRTTRRASRKL